MTSRLPGLLESEPGTTMPAARPPARRRSAGETLRGWWDAARATPKRRRALGIVCAVLVLGVGTGLFLRYGPVFQPDYRRGKLDRVMNYTLLTDEFNNLPVEKRMELIGQLVQRLRKMDAGDSVLLAGFASGVAGAARDQLEENASRLAIDLWDKHAKDYDSVPEAEREEFLEQAFVDFQKTMEAVGGQVRDVSDSDRINEVRKQAARDRQALRDPENQPPPEAIGRMVSVMNRTLGSNANPTQRVRGAQMMRDMVRHFRGQDIATGKPK